VAVGRVVLIVLALALLLAAFRALREGELAQAGFVGAHVLAGGAVMLFVLVVFLGRGTPHRGLVATLIAWLELVVAGVLTFVHPLTWTGWLQDVGIDRRLWALDTIGVAGPWAWFGAIWLVASVWGFWQQRRHTRGPDVGLW
jgi:hypothetical protein